MLQEDKIISFFFIKIVNSDSYSRIASYNFMTNTYIASFSLLSINMYLTNFTETRNIFHIISKSLGKENLHRANFPRMLFE